MIENKKFILKLLNEYQKKNKIKFQLGGNTPVTIGNFPGPYYNDQLNELYTVIISKDDNLELFETILKKFKYYTRVVDAQQIRSKTNKIQYIVKDDKRNERKYFINQSSWELNMTILMYAAAKLYWLCW